MNVAANSIPAFCLPPFVDPALLSDVFTADNIQLGTVWARSEEFPEYAVSCDGQVMRLQTGLVLRPDVVGNGYMRVSLYRKGRASRRKVHRLVASAFIPNPSNKPFVNHEDGDKIHNRVVNLAWATSKENAEHAVRTGLSRGGKKLAEADVAEIRRQNGSGISQRALARKFHVNSATVSKICSRKSWVNVTEVIQ